MNYKMLSHASENIQAFDGEDLEIKWRNKLSKRNPIVLSGKGGGMVEH